MTTVKYYVCLILLLAIYSCDKKSSNSSLEKSEKWSIEKRDSLASARIETYKRDSLILSEEKKAIGNINFGISESEFRKQEKIFMGKSKDLYWQSDDGYRYYKNVIGKYKFFKIVPSYYNGKLYSIYLRGYPVLYDKYNSEMPSQKESLDMVFNDKYGKSEYNYDLKQWHTMENNSQYPSASWVVGKKVINTVISASRESYSYDVSIFLSDINSEIKEMERFESVSKNKKGVNIL